MELLRRLWFLLNRRRLERELAEEMEAHRAQMDDPRRFGGTLKLREESGDAWGWHWLDSVAQDVRYAARGLRRSPVFALTAVLILSLGAGANLALFQVLHTLVLSPAPVRDPATLVRLERKGKGYSSSNVPYMMTQYIRRHNSLFSAIVTETGNDLAWGADAAERVKVRYVSANYFDELGYGAAEGRVFHEHMDERPDAPPVAVLAHEFWQRRFGGQAPAVGSVIRLNDRPATVAGVARPEFQGLRPATVDVYVLIHQLDHYNAGAEFLRTWASSNTDLYARLKPGVRPADIADGLKPVIQALAQEQPKYVKPDVTLPASSGLRRFLRDRDAQQTRQWSALAVAIFLAVLLVACSNLASLVLARAQQRMAELQLRAAIGAGRMRLVRQLTTESLLLAVAGSLAGGLVAFGVLRWLESNPEVPNNLRFTAGAMTMAAAAALAVFCTAFIGLIPAWTVSRGNLEGGLRGKSAATGSRFAGRLQKALLAAQVTGGCALLLLAGLWVAGFARLVRQGPGFDYQKLAVLDPSLVKHGVTGAEARLFWERTRASLAAHPEIEAAALSSHSPLGSSLSEGSYPDAPELQVTSLHVEPAFFEVMRIPLLRGRNLAPGDDHRRTVIIGKRLAERMYGTLDVIGLGFPRSNPEKTIVGVAADARLIKVTATNTSAQYSPIDPESYQFLTLVARTRSGPERVLEGFRTAARSADRRVLARTELVTGNLERRLSASRLLGSVLGGVGGLALSLATVGTFGLVAYTVGRRTREFGIRRALGASNGAIVRSVLQGLSAPLAGGLAAGVLIGLALGHLLSGEPLYFEPNDALGAGGSILALALVVGAAALLPARLALRVEPLRALRHD